MEWRDSQRLSADEPRCVTGREEPVDVVVVAKGDADLLQVVLAGEAASGSGGLRGRKQARSGFRSPR